MKYIIITIILLIFGTNGSFAENLVTEDGQLITDEGGNAFITESDTVTLPVSTKKVNLKAVITANAAKVESRNKNQLIIRTVKNETILITRSNPTNWIMEDPAQSTNFFNVFKISLTVKKVRPNSKIGLFQNPQSFTTNDQGFGEGELYVKADTKNVKIILTTKEGEKQFHEQIVNSDIALSCTGKITFTCN